MKVAILLLLGSVFVSAQSSEILRQKYGAPTSVTHTEVYTARPFDKDSGLSVEVQVTYNRDMKLCKLRVEVSPYPTGSDFQLPKAVIEQRDQLIQNVVDEIIPMKERGKILKSGFLSIPCSADGCGGSWERYEKVSIFNSGNSHRYSDIGFAGVSCN